MIAFKVLARIKGKGRGGVYTEQFSGYWGVMQWKGAGTPCSRRTLRKLSRDSTTTHARTLFLASNAVRRCHCGGAEGRDAVRLQPTGAYAANLLGLSDQVPMRIVFLTDGLGRRVKIGRKEVILKRTTRAYGHSRKNQRVGDSGLAAS